jgi:hypothetical protein
MDMDQKQEQVVELPGPGAWPQPDATAARSAPRASRKQPRLETPGREAVFDIADFEAIAIFAGLRPRPRRLG